MISLFCVLARGGQALHAAETVQAAGSSQAASGPAARETVLHAQGVVVTSLSYDERVFFNSGDDRPRPEAASVLDALAARLAASVTARVGQDREAAHVAVLGHTDSVGSDAYNLDLSRRRALDVVEALEARGIAAGRLRAVAVGKRQPVASDRDEAGRARNRRVEFLISPSAAAIDAILRARPSVLKLRARNPAALSLHVRQPKALTRAPFGAAVPY